MFSYMLNSIYRLSSVTLCLLLISIATVGQTKIIRGTIKDAHSSEIVPFASLQFKNAGSGKLTDSAGNFTFTLNNWPADTLEVTYVGYQDYLLPIDSTLL